MKQVNAGLIGLGTVGSGVLEVLKSQQTFFKKSLGIDLRLKAIADQDASKKEGLDLSGIAFATDAKQLVNDPDIDIIIELIGGVTAARKIIVDSIAAKKHVVTANKHLLAKFGGEIFPAAEKAGVDVYFEASVGGGIPIIKALRESLISNDIRNIKCIINGTTNYILTRMLNERKDFQEMLADAQKNGFAEADPAFDIDGIDASHKVAIMASLAFGGCVDLDSVHTEGIGDLTLEDIIYADELGYVIKLIGVIRNIDGRIDARVHPAMLPKGHLLSGINGVYNGVLLNGNFVDSIMLTGKGAGKYPTASSVVSDMVDIAKNIMDDSPKRISMSFYAPENMTQCFPISEIDGRYYLRFTVIDQPGVLGKITAKLGEKRVSIASVIQKERAPRDQVPVVILTHAAREKHLFEAIREVDALKITKRPTQIIRIEEENEGE